MKKLLRLLLLSFFPLTLLQSQVSCDQGDNCNIGNLGFASYQPSGTSDFCETDMIELENSSTFSEFDLFVIDWGDESRDSINSYESVSHNYDFSNIDRCQEGPSFKVVISFIGIKFCGDTFSCSEGTLSLFVKLKPEAEFIYSNEICITDEVLFREDACNEDNDSYLWDFGDGTTSNDENPRHRYNSPGRYNVTLEVSNNCGNDRIVRTLTVVDQPKADFTILSNSTQGDFCIPATVSLTDQSNEFSRTTWDILPTQFPDSSWCFIDTNMTLSTNDIQIILKESMDYFVTLNATNACGHDLLLDTITAIDLPSAQLTDPLPFCEMALYTPDISYSNESGIESVLWTFPQGTPSSSTELEPMDISYDLPGTYTVQLQIESQCGNSTYETQLTVAEKVIPDISNNRTLFCSNDEIDTLVANVSGGIWLGIGIVNENIGSFDPSLVTSGSTSISYQLQNGECSGEDNINIDIRDAVQVEFPETTFCISDSPMALSVSLPNGFFEGNGITSDSLFDPLQAGAGDHLITYAVQGTNGCVAHIETVITVEEIANIQPLGRQTLCNISSDILLNDAFNIIVPSDVSIRWEGPGIINPTGTFNNNGIDSSSVELVIFYESTFCSTSDTVIVEIEDLPLLSITPDSTICVASSTLQLSANIQGGIWTGNGIDSQTGIIEVANTQNGPNGYFYTINQGTLCEIISETSITVIDLGLNLDPGEEEEFCAQSGQVQFSMASPAGGFWRGDNGLLDAQLGIIDIDLLQSDTTYVFEYCLRDTSIPDCEACKSKMVSINGLPRTDFNVDTVACLNTTITPNNLSMGADSLLWKLPNGQTSNQNAPEITFSNLGIEVIALEAISNEGCSSQISKSVEVINTPSASFTLENTSGCEPIEIIFTDLSSGFNSLTSWSLNGDSIGSAVLQNFIIDSIGEDTTYIVEQQVENRCGINTQKEEIQVLARTSARFGLQMDEGCSPLEVAFSNASSGNPNIYQWDLGNGVFSSDSLPPEQVYESNIDEPKEYIISLVTQNQCNRDTFFQTLTVNPPNVNAFIQLDTLSACPPFTLQLRNFSTAGSTAAWEWFSETGIRSSSIVSNPEVLFEESGRYTIILSATNCGTDTDTAFVEVLPKPVAQFTNSTSICAFDTIPLTNLSQGAINYEWIIESEINSTEDVPFLQIDSAGVYAIQLVASNEFNCTDTVSNLISILDLPEFTINSDPVFDCPPFTTTISHTGNSSNTYSWINSNSETSSLFNPIFSFTSPGEYSITGVATDQFGCSTQSTFAQITAHPVPIADFTLNKLELCTDLDTLQAINTSQDAITYQWLVNEQEASTNVDLSYVPTNATTTNIQLVSANSLGCKDTTAQDIQIFETPILMPSSIFDQACQKDEIILEVLDPNAEEYIWTIPGIITTTGSTTKLVIEEIGIYDLQIFARNGALCSDSLFIEGYFEIFESPKAIFTFDNNPDPDLIGEVSFINESENYTSVEWTFGDGDQSSQENPTHIYNINNPDSVVLTAINNNNGQFICEDSYAELIKPEPIARFFAPNALSPDNGTSEVNVFKPAGIGIIEYDISIYSPWGEIIWYSDKLENGQPMESWKGILPSGENAPQGVYVYKATVTFEDRTETHTGPVHLIR